MITQDTLKELVFYNHETGVFTRKTLVRGKGVLGEVLGNKNKYGHLKMTIKNKCYFLHRLAWLYVYGSFPQYQIDHINGIPDDNRIKNLRDVGIRTNAENKKKAQKNNASGFLGVCWHKRKNLYMASIKIQGKTKFIGYFKDAVSAHEAYLQKKRQLHAGCTI